MNGSEKFWRRVIVFFGLVCLFYMLVALWIGLRQLDSRKPVKFHPLSWPIEILERLPIAPPADLPRIEPPEEFAQPGSWF